MDGWKHAYIHPYVHTYLSMGILLKQLRYDEAKNGGFAYSNYSACMYAYIRNLNTVVVVDNDTNAIIVVSSSSSSLSWLLLLLLLFRLVEEWSENSLDPGAILDLTTKDQEYVLNLYLDVADEVSN